MADKPKKIIPDADYKRLMPKFRAHVISESAAKRLGLTNKPAPKTPPVKKSEPKAEPPKKTAPKIIPPETKSSALKKKVVDDAPITISKGKRGATKWRKGNGPWRYDEPPQQHKPKVAEPRKEEAKPKAEVKSSPPKPVAPPKPPAEGTSAKPHPRISAKMTWEIDGHCPAGTESVDKLLGKLGPHVSRFVGAEYHARIDFAPSHTMASETLGGAAAGGMYHPDTGRIRINADYTKHGAVDVTVAHELGHALDYRVGSEATEEARYYARYGSRTPLSGSLTRVSLADGAHPRLRDLGHALEGSAELKRLREARRDPLTVPAAHRELDYLLTPTEVFARAFTQWAIEKHGSPEAKANLARRPTSEQFGLLPSQWHKDEFKPIAREFDKLFG